jgi:hypothetical protein
MKECSRTVLLYSYSSAAAASTSECVDDRNAAFAKALHKKERERTTYVGVQRQHSIEKLYSPKSSSVSHGIATPCFGC